MRIHVLSLVIVLTIVGGTAWTLHRRSASHDPAGLVSVHWRPTQELEADALSRRYAELALARLTRLDDLKAYIIRRNFPQNTTHPGQVVPVFLDAHGNSCAVAALIQADGHGDLVEAVSRSDNHVRIADLERGPVLDWILRSGLTQEECALIQPTYGFLEIPQHDDLITEHLVAAERFIRAASEHHVQLAFARLIAAGPPAGAQGLTSHWTEQVHNRARLTSVSDARVRLTCRSRSGNWFVSGDWIALDAGREIEVALEPDTGELAVEWQVEAATEACPIVLAWLP